MCCVLRTHDVLGFAYAFVQVWTVPLPCEAIGGGAGASAFASGSGAQLLSAEVWEVQDIQWDDSEEGPGNHA